MVRIAGKQWKWATLVACLSLSACSNHAPAPVASLGKDYQSLERGSYRGSYYEVKKGDTLYFISYITGKEVQELVSANNLSQPYTIFPGQKLQLWKPKYVAPRYGKAAPVAVASTTKKTPAKTTSKPAATQPKPAAKPKPASQQTAQAAKPKPKAEQKVANKNVDQGRTKEYSQKTKSNKVVTNKPSSTNNKVDKWSWPATGRVVAKFSNTQNGNKGIDIAGKRGQAIKASADGVVVYAGNALRGYGNLVIIKHSDDYLSAYAHNDQLLVKEQQKVTLGQKIASMGSSGTSDVRLHFEIRYKGKSVDPMRYLPR
ncbi:peptidoglycan DD-metalloendopeptidase family protein [Photobacterium sanctipauli]